MTTFLEVVEALIASREHCAGSLGRLQFWVDQFGHLPITEVGEDDVDRAAHPRHGHTCTLSYIAPSRSPALPLW